MWTLQETEHISTQNSKLLNGDIQLLYKLIIIPYFNQHSMGPNQNYWLMEVQEVVGGPASGVDGNKKSDSGSRPWP